MKLYRDLVRAHVIVRGEVQGVGYRAWTRKTAIAEGLNGWVRNLPDGSVEAVFEGERETVGAMVELLKQGPRLAAVSGLDCTFEINFENLTGFEVRS